MIKLKRVYLPSEKKDGFRILVDRLWPRGMKKESADIDLWLKDVAPSSELRKWFSHDAQKWDAFQERYGVELGGKSELLNELRALHRKHATITLLFAAKDERFNQAVVLRKLLSSAR